MVGRSYVNAVNPMEVSLAIEQLLIAPEGTAWTIARVDPDAPPSGFKNLGAVVEDTPTIEVTREQFELETGIPKILQFSVTNRMTGTFNATLYSNSWRKLQFALGNYTAVSSHTVVTSISSVSNQNVITLTTTSASLTVGRQIVIASNTVALGFDAVDGIETQIASKHSDGLTYFLSPTPIRTPTDGQYVGYYAYVQQAVGTARNTYYHLLGVCDFVDGSQIVHQMVRVKPAGTWSENISPDNVAQIPLSFQAFGFSDAAIPGATGTELIVARRIYFPRLS